MIRKEYGFLFYINILLFLIIIINIIIIVFRERKKRLENFETNNTDIIKVNTRPCTLHLTNDDNLCNQLSDIYKMSDLQIQVQLNKMEYNGNTTSYSMLQFVKDNKKTLPINACKIELNKFREVNNLYASSNNVNLYKNIYRDINYNETNLSGYCLSDITEYSQINISNIINMVNPLISSNIFFTADTDNPTNIYDENNSRYLALKVKNRVNRDTLLSDVPFICSDVKVSLEDKLQFLRLHCALYDKTQLVIDNIDNVYYDANLRNFRQTETSNILEPLFSYIYDKKQIKYVPTTKNVLIYKFTQNFCNKIEEYSIYDNVQFSLSELNIMPQIIKYNIELSPTLFSSNIINDSIPHIVANKMTNILKSNNDIVQQIALHTSNQLILNEKYAQMKIETCPSVLNNNTKALCVLQTNAIQDEYNMLETEKYSLNDILQKQRTVYYDLVETKKKIDNMKLTITDINIFIKPKVPIQYSKYADMISNDDYLYIML